MARGSKYPAPSRVHTKVRRAVSQGTRNITRPEIAGSLGRFTTSVPRINGFNTGTVPKNY